MLGESDAGIILFRKVLEQQIRIVEQGGVPMNVFSDPLVPAHVRVIG